MNLDEFHKESIELRKENTPYVCATLVDTKGSAPQDVGAKIIFTKNGLHWGTIGGGKIENHCQQFSLELLNDEQCDPSPLLRSWNLQKDIGMTCGGVVSVYFEIFKPEKRWHIAVFGAGHVSQKLCPILSGLDSQLFCIDSRKEWLDKFSLKGNFKTICLDSPKEFLKEIPPESFILLMTQGHSTDLPILKEALENYNFPYVGVIGSQAKANNMKKGLKEQGVAAELMDKFVCPIGEAIGNNSPYEIGLSITAQVLKVRDQIFQTAKRSTSANKA